MTHHIAVLAGDYIGPEIMASALAVMAHAAAKFAFDYETTTYPFGGAAIDACGEPLPETTVAGAKAADAILLAAIGGPKWDDAPQRPEDGLLAIRQALQLYANIRPTKISDAQIADSPLKPEIVRGTDFVIARELTSGAYFGKPRELAADHAIDTMYYNREEVERIMVTGFELAMQRQHHVTIVDKSNVLATSKFWRATAERIAKRFPEVSVDYRYIDATTMAIMTHPTAFDVIITANLFGDILSDEAAQITGSIGTIPSMSAGADGPNLYEPIHGSAPDIAGRGIANPIAMIKSVAMMAQYSFQANAMAQAIEAACDAVIEAGITTPDLGGTATTQEVTDTINARI
ncbi:MAG: 3-isopropylmalate dehydrogenase [Lactobacillus sp.]|jgi:3-isopropylmalate dehydrogenase|nr:3-isopropylmalate dehydrogenase [Lactobacillus sp.]MCI2033962.1 3-isopropylmalate dehydrogenase [Lactobacillus sp.]